MFISTVSKLACFLSFMSHRSKVSPTLDSLPSWISDHLGEGSSYITDEVRQSPRSPMEDPSIAEVAPLGDVHPSVTKEHNTMTSEELDLLRETYLSLRAYSSDSLRRARPFFLLALAR